MEISSAKMIATIKEAAVQVSTKSPYCNINTCSEQINEVTITTAKIKPNLVEFFWPRTYSQGDQYRFGFQVRKNINFMWLQMCIGNTVWFQNSLNRLLSDY